LPNRSAPFFDDFSVIAVGDVPEPALAAILLTGLGLPGFIRRRKAPRSH
jgi:hypothetical protein